MADKLWKRVEREKCRALGGERSGPTGRDTPDCDESVHVALEVKAYKKFVFLTKDWDQAVANAAKVGKPPVLNVRESGRGGRDCVQMREPDWFRLLSASTNERGFITLSKIARTGRDLSVVRLAWPDFVRLYRAAYKLDNKE